ncbi:MAG: trans-2,3-dihydro-3-hydroxyanthranilate isomerase [Frankiaceae bacterium]|nr:trans-2,3-dihydro-3-hydroxyanthranilate isomerase [Frankiaceae bacterium]
MRLDYHVLDVFTDRAFAGNPLAVVLDADELSTAAMQTVAREFNLSETTFPLPASSAGADYRLRIFTPSTELPFAGHPSVGSAWLLHSLGRIGDGQVVQECGAGLLPVQIGSEEVTLTGGTPVVGEPLDVEPFCAAVGLSSVSTVGAATAAAIGTPVRWAGMGIDFAFLHVHDWALGETVPDLARLGELGHSGVAVFSYSQGRAHARVFAVGAGVPEDPATGSAALGLGVWLVASGLVPPDGESAYVVDQGIEMGRPSRLSCRVAAEAGRAVRGTVSGSVVPVARGQIEAPAD